MQQRESSRLAPTNSDGRGGKKIPGSMPAATRHTLGINWVRSSTFILVTGWCDSLVGPKNGSTKHGGWLVSISWELRVSHGARHSCGRSWPRQSRPEFNSCNDTARLKTSLRCAPAVGQQWQLDITDWHADVVFYGQKRPRARRARSPSRSIRTARVRSRPCRYCRHFCCWWLRWFSLALSSTRRGPTPKPRCRRIHKIIALNHDP